MFKRTRRFLGEVKAELNKVTWPTKNHTLQQTGFVIIFVTILACFLGTVDFFLSEAVKLIIH